MAKCDITPISAFQSTNLSSKIDSFGRLSDRVLRSLGYPFVNVEIHRDTLYENISLACEMFAKFAGYTQEYLMFDSSLYDKDHGIRLDHLFSLQNTDTFTKQIEYNNESKDFSKYIEEPETLYVCNSAIDGSFFTNMGDLSSSLGTLSANETNFTTRDLDGIDRDSYAFIKLNSLLRYDANTTSSITVKLQYNELTNSTAFRSYLFLTTQTFVDLPTAFNTDVPGYFSQQELSEGSNTLTISLPDTEADAGSFQYLAIVTVDETGNAVTGTFKISNLEITNSTHPDGTVVAFNGKTLLNGNTSDTDSLFKYTTLDNTKGLFKQASTGGTFVNQIFSKEIYDTIIGSQPALSGFFDESYKEEFTRRGSVTGKREKHLNSFDYDVMDYRKVIAIQDFEEGSTTGINTLFTIEQTLAQQTYFSYAMGNYGFDLVSWYVLKDFLETREKLLATRRSYTFDDRTQIMRMYPQPNARGDDVRFYGIVSCYVERPIRDIIKEHWVYQYTLALTKIAVANIRGKYGNVTLFGGGSLNSGDLMSQGLAEKEKLETALYEGAPGLGDAEPPMFFVG